MQIFENQQLKGRCELKINDIVIGSVILITEILQSF